MPSTSAELHIVVAHALPGRLRLRLSHSPRRAARTIAMVKGHLGVHDVAYTAATNNLLIRFDPLQIRLEEIILRAALCLSADYRLRPVMIKTSGFKVPLGALALFSGFSLLVGHWLSWVAPSSGPTRVTRYLGGLSVTAAIGEHIYLDLKNKGRFHPESLSIGYLLTAFLRGNLLKGASIAWLTTFARHLMEPPQKVLKLLATPMDPACDEDRCEYEAEISREVSVQGYQRLFAGVPKLVLGMVTDYHLSAEDRIFKEIQTLSREHDDVLEGLENVQRGIRLRVGS